MRFIATTVFVITLTLLVGCSTTNPKDNGYRSDVTPDCDGSDWR